MPKEKLLWNGPIIDGITQSMLSKFAVCRERFRLMVIEGLREPQKFSGALEYGNLWHICEEMHGQYKPWNTPLKNYVAELCLKYPDEKEEISKWYNICKVQYPIYLGYWNDQWSALKRIPIAHELVFDIPYTLPSSRVVRLRGKFDGVDLKGKNIFLQENKTKGDIDIERLAGELPLNNQTMIYVIALRCIKNQKLEKEYPEFSKVWWGKKDAKIAGVLYNVVRRPLSDWRGKFNIKQRKGHMVKGKRVGAETGNQYYERLGELIKENSREFFERIEIQLSNSDIDRFERECLIPMLEQLCDWWEWVSEHKHSPECFGNKVHSRYPYGIYNPILEERRDIYFNYIRTGSMMQLEKVTSLFRELA